MDESSRDVFDVLGNQPSKDIAPIQEESIKDVFDVLGSKKSVTNVSNSLLGTPYQFGGNNPKKGVDCSWLTKYVVDQSEGMKLPRTAIEQYKLGMPIAKNQLQPGDLVFFDTGVNHRKDNQIEDGKYITHVGIIRDDGMLVHASSKKGVVAVPLSQMPKPIGYRRWVKQDFSSAIQPNGNANSIKPDIKVQSQYSANPVMDIVNSLTNPTPRVLPTNKPQSIQDILNGAAPVPYSKEEQEAQLNLIAQYAREKAKAKKTPDVQYIMSGLDSTMKWEPGQRDRYKAVISEVMNAKPKTDIVGILNSDSKSKIEVAGAKRFIEQSKLYAQKYLLVKSLVDSGKLPKINMAKGDLFKDKSQEYYKMAMDAQDEAANIDRRDSLKNMTWQEWVKESVPFIGNPIKAIDSAIAGITPKEFDEYASPGGKLAVEGANLATSLAIPVGTAITMGPKAAGIVNALAYGVPKTVDTLQNVQEKGLVQGLLQSTPGERMFDPNATPEEKWQSGAELGFTLLAAAGTSKGQQVLKSLKGPAISEDVLAAYKNKFGDIKQDFIDYFKETPWRNLNDAAKKKASAANVIGQYSAIEQKNKKPYEDSVDNLISTTYNVNKSELSREGVGTIERSLPNGDKGLTGELSKDIATTLQEGRTKYDESMEWLKTKLPDNSEVIGITYKEDGLVVTYKNSSGRELNKTISADSVKQSSSSLEKQILREREFANNSNNPNVKNHSFESVLPPIERLKRGVDHIIEKAQNVSELQKYYRANGLIGTNKPYSVTQDEFDSIIKNLTDDVQVYKNIGAFKEGGPFGESLSKIVDQGFTGGRILSTPSVELLNFKFPSKTDIHFDEKIAKIKETGRNLIDIFSVEKISKRPFGIGKRIESVSSPQVERAMINLYGRNVLKTVRELYKEYNIADSPIQKLKDAITSISRTETGANIEKNVKPVGVNLTADDIIKLKSSIKVNPRYTDLENRTAIEAFDNLLKFGDVPNNYELNLLRRTFGDDFVKVIKNIPTTRKITDTITSWINLPRALMASLDDSAVLRQGGSLFIAHPGVSARATLSSLKAFKDPVYAQNVEDSIRRMKLTRPGEEPISLYPVMKDSGLELTESGANPHLTAKEEDFMSNLVGKVPWINPSERAYVTFLNQQRADTFSILYARLADKWKNDPEQLGRDAKLLASFINKATGRGSLGPLNEYAPLFNTFMFAPRYSVSRFQYPLSALGYDLNNIGKKGTQASNYVRGMISSEILKDITGRAMVLGLAKAAGADIEMDPASSKFGSIMVDNRRYDILSGEQQAWRLIWQVMTGSEKTADGIFRDKKASDTISKFIRSKVSPVPGMAWDFASGKDYMGNERSIKSADSWGREITNMTTPLGVRDILQQLREEGLGAKGIGGSILGLFGINSINYDKQKSDPGNRSKLTRAIDFLAGNEFKKGYNAKDVK